jgi:hypothetical protein
VVPALSFRQAPVMGHGHGIYYEERSQHVSKLAWPNSPSSEVSLMLDGGSGFSRHTKFGVLVHLETFPSQT